MAPESSSFRLFYRCSAILTQYPKRSLLLLVLWTCFVGYGLSNLGFEFKIKDFFPSSDPELQKLNALHEAFGPDDQNVTWLIQAEDVWTPEILSYAHQIATTLELPLHAMNPSSEIPEARYALGSVQSLFTSASFSGDGDTITVAPLLEHPPSTFEEAQKAKAIAMNNPLFAGRLVSNDGKLLAINVSIDTYTESVNELVPVIERMQSVLHGFARPEGVRLEAIGIPVVRVHILQQEESDLATFLPLGGLLTLIILGVLFKDRQGIIVPFVAVAMSVAFYFGLLGWLDIKLDILTTVLPTIVIVYGVADGVHMLNRIREEGNSDQAINTAMAHLGIACLLTSGTTAIGFLSLLVSDMALIRNFGWLSAGGVIGAYFISLLALPIGAKLLPSHKIATQPSSVEQNTKWLEILADWVYEKRQIIVPLSVGLSLFLTWTATQVGVDNTLLDAFKKGHPVRLATQTAEEHLHGVISLDVTLQANDKDLLSFERLMAVQKLKQWLIQQDGITDAISYTDLLQEAFRGVTGQPTISKDPQAIAQVALIVESGLKESLLLTDRQRFNDFGRISLKLADLGSSKQKQLRDTIAAEAKRITQPVGIDSDVAGTTIVAQKGVDRLTQTLLKSTLLAMAIILVLIGLLFKSARVALASIVPNILPLLSALGVMWVTGIKIDPTTMIVFSVGLGIAVDDTIHFIVRYQEEAKRTAHVQSRLRATLRSTGFAMTVTSMILIAGFASVLASQFPSTIRFGFLGVVIFASALFCDIFITPAWFAYLKVWQPNKR